jgi:hypothetical protein
VYRAFLVKHTNILGDPNPRRYIQSGRSLMIILVQEFLWIILSLCNPVYYLRLVESLPACKSMVQQSLSITSLIMSTYFSCAIFHLRKLFLQKHAHECFLSSIGVTAKAYHTNNGRFADKGFKDDCTTSNQSIMFCGVGNHYQNGIAERKIKELTLGAWTLLLHAKKNASRIHLDNFMIICPEMRWRQIEYSCPLS